MLNLVSWIRIPRHQPIRTRTVCIILSVLILVSICSYPPGLLSYHRYGEYICERNNKYQTRIVSFPPVFSHNSAFAGKKKRTKLLWLYFVVVECAHFSFPPRKSCLEISPTHTYSHFPTSVNRLDAQLTRYLWECVEVEVPQSRFVILSAVCFSESMVRSRLRTSPSVYSAAR